MSDEQPTGGGPGYWIFAGIVVILLGGLLSLVSSGSGAGELGLLLGGALVLFGVLAKAIQIGVRSARKE